MATYVDIAIAWLGLRTYRDFLLIPAVLASSGIGGDVGYGNAPGPSRPTGTYLRSVQHGAASLALLCQAALVARDACAAVSFAAFDAAAAAASKLLSAISTACFVAL
jgi:hypothetical protein